MTKNEAIIAVDNYLSENMSDHLVFKYSNYEYNVETEQIEARFDVDRAVNYAYNIGRKSNFFKNAKDYINTLINNINIEPVLIYNEIALTDYMDFLEISLPDQVRQASYYIDNDKLIITTGSTGSGINKEALKRLVLEGLQDLSFNNSIFVIPTYTTYPNDLNIDSIHNEVYKEMSNAYYTTEPYAIYVEQRGVNFDIEKVKNTVNRLTEQMKNLNLIYNIQNLKLQLMILEWKHFQIY